MPQGVQGEAAGVAEEVEDPPPPGVGGRGPPILALVQEEAGLLPRLEVDEIGDAVLVDLDRFVGQGAVHDPFLDLQTFLRGDALLAPEDDPFGLRPGDELGDDPVAFLIEGEAGELHGEPAVEAVDRQAGEAVGLAEDEATGRPRAARSRQVEAHRAGIGDLRRQELPIDRPVFPAVEPDPDRAPVVEQPPGDELAFVADDGHLVAGPGVALDPVDRGDEDPGMAGEERAGSPRLDDDAGEAGHRGRSFGRWGRGEEGRGGFRGLRRGRLRPRRGRRGSARAGS